MIAHLDVTEKKTTDVQWNLLNQWCAEQVGVDPSTTVDIPNMGHVHLAGVLGGVLCDRWAERPAELPGAVAVNILSVVSPKRGSEMNPGYVPEIAGALSVIFQVEYRRLTNGGALPQDELAF